MNTTNQDITNDTNDQDVQQEPEDIQNNTNNQDVQQEPENKPKRSRGRPKGFTPGSLNDDPVRNRAYRREYYHTKLKCELHCSVCNTIFGCKSSLTRHNIRNKKCQMLKMKNSIIELLGTDILNVVVP